MRVLGNYSHTTSRFRHHEPSARVHSEEKPVKSLATVGLSAFAGTLAVLAGCTEMPVIALNDHHDQTKLSSAYQWLAVANDISASIVAGNGKTVAGDEKTGCVTISAGVTKTPTKVQRFLVNAVTEKVIATTSSPKVYTIPSSVRADTEPDLVKLPDSGTTGSACDSVVIDAFVITHHGGVARAYPGKYTLLATGLVVLRNVVRAFSEASAIGMVAFGEGAFWASSGFRSGDTVTEVAITMSRVNKDGMYISQYEDVYYIDSGEAELYPPDTDVVEAQIKKAKEEQEQARRNELAAASAQREAEQSRKVVQLAISRLKKVEAEKSNDKTNENPADETTADTYIDSQLYVSSPELSACDPYVPVRVTGEALSPDKSSYSLNSVPPLTFSYTPARKSAVGRDTVDAVFTGFQREFSGSDVLVFEMTTPGQPRTALIRVNRHNGRGACNRERDAGTERDAGRENKLVVVQRIISACGPDPVLVLEGEHLSGDPKDYVLGTIQASAFGNGPPKSTGVRDRQRVQVVFKNIQKEITVDGELQLAVTSPGWPVQRVAVEVEAPSQSCSKGAGTPADGKKPGKAGTSITLAPPGGNVVDASDVCKLPLKLVVGGPGASTVRGASTLGGLYPGKVTSESDGAKEEVSISFATLPDFQKAPLKQDVLPVVLTLTTKKSITIDVPAKCGS